MKNLSKKFHLVSILIISLTFTNCTAWPAIAALLMGGSKGGGGILPLLPGGGDEAVATGTPSQACLATATAGTPQVIKVDSDTANGTYKAGTSMKIYLVFSEEVSVIGTPQLTLNNNKVINYTATSTDTITNDRLEFTYNVAALDDIAPLDYKNTTSLSLNGGTIKSVAGSLKDAKITLNPVGTACGSLVKNKTINIDTKDPTITNITSSDSDTSTYGPNSTVTISVTFDEIVNVTNFPTLTLNTAPTVGTATYTSGSGSNTLVFTFTVGPSGSDEVAADLNVTSVNLSGGTILDVATNAAILTTPTGENLADNKNIKVDSNARTVSFDAATSSGNESTTTVTIPVSISAAPLSNATATYSITGGSASGNGVDYTFASGTLTFTSAGATTQNITFTVNNDLINELNETVEITLVPAINCANGTNLIHTQSTTTIQYQPLLYLLTTQRLWRMEELLLLLLL